MFLSSLGSLNVTLSLMQMCGGTNTPCPLQQDANQAKVAMENGAVLAGGVELIQPVSRFQRHTNIVNITSSGTWKYLISVL